jgi:hypothetical protein
MPQSPKVETSIWIKTGLSSSKDGLLFFEKPISLSHAKILQITHSNTPKKLIRLIPASEDTGCGRGH